MAKKSKKNLGEMSPGDILKSFKRKKQMQALKHEEFTPKLPSVDLFPSGVRTPIEIRKIRRGIIAALGIVVLGTAGLWYNENGKIEEAQTRLTAAQAEQSKLETEIRSLAPVQSLYGEITRTEDIVNAAMATEVTTTVIFDELAKIASNNDAFIKSQTVKYTSGAVESEGKNAGSGCPIVDPFSSVTSVGCLVFSGSAPTREDVIGFINDAEESAYFTNIYTAKTSASGGNGFAFSGSVNITTAGLTSPELVVDEKTDNEEQKVDSLINSAGTPGITNDVPAGGTNDLPTDPFATEQN